MSEQKRTIFTGTQKAKVALEAIKRGPKPVRVARRVDRSYAKIGQLNMALDWLSTHTGH